MKPGFVPNQHGAWAMLVIPFLFGMVAAGPALLHVPLFLGWLLAYLFSFPFLQWIRTKRTKVYAKPMLLYGGLLLPVAALLAVAEPGLARFAPLFVPLLLVNIHYARRNRERALLNDLAAVVQFSLMVFVAFQAGGGGDFRLAAELFALSVLYFAGTAFYVKTMIRERHNVKYYRLSVGYHAALLAVGAAGFHPALAAPLAILLARAALLPRMSLTVKQIGMLEIALAVLFACSVLAIYPGAMP